MYLKSTCVTQVVLTLSYLFNLTIIEGLNTVTWSYQQQLADSANLYFPSLITLLSSLLSVVLCVSLNTSVKATTRMRNVNAYFLIFQFTEEKLGQAEKTELDAHLEKLLIRAESTKQWTEKIMKQTEVLLQPNPSKITLFDFQRTDTDISKQHRAPTHTMFL